MALAAKEAPAVSPFTSITPPLSSRRGRTRRGRFHLFLCAQLDCLGLNVRLLVRNQVASVNGAGPAAFVHGLNRDALSVRARHSSNSIRPRRSSIDLREMSLPLEHKLARLEVKQERGRLAIFLTAASQRPHPELGFTHP